MLYYHTKYNQSKWDFALVVLCSSHYCPSGGVPGFTFTSTFSGTVTEGAVLPPLLSSGLPKNRKKNTPNINKTAAIKRAEELLDSVTPGLFTTVANYHHLLHLLPTGSHPGVKKELK